MFSTGVLTCYYDRMKATIVCFQAATEIGPKNKFRPAENKKTIGSEIKKKIGTEFWVTMLSIVFYSSCLLVLEL